MGLIHEHHPLGPSTLDRRAACPGSYAAELPLWGEPQEQDDDTERGAARHAAAAEGLRNPERRPLLLAALLEEDRPVVSSWWDYWSAKVAGAHSVGKGGVESMVEMADHRHGRCDSWLCWVAHGGTTVLTVADLKGTPPGRARWNLQLADYAAGICHGLGEEHQPDRIELALVSRAGVDEWALSHDEMADRQQVINRIRDACLRAGAPRIPGAACTHCRAAATCATRTAVAVQATALADPVAAISALEPAQRTDLLDRLLLAVDRLSEAADAIKAGIRAGNLEVPHYRSIPKQVQEWRDAAAARDAVLTLAQAAGLPAADVTPLVSASKAAALLGKDAIASLIERRAGTFQVRRIKGCADQ